MGRWGRAVKVAEINAALDQMEVALNAAQEALETAQAEKDAAVAAERERCAKIARFMPMPPDFDADGKDFLLARGVYTRACAEIARKIQEGK